jgi:hypothetical protein
MAGHVHLPVSEPERNVPEDAIHYQLFSFANWLRSRTGHFSAQQTGGKPRHQLLLSLFELRQLRLSVFGQGALRQDL